MIFFGVSALAALVLVLRFAAELVVRIAAIAFVAMSAACIIAVRLTARRLFVGLAGRVCDDLDNLLAEEPQRIFALEDETLESKIRYRLVKVWEITRGLAKRSDEQKRSIQELVSDISHQLKTPLANIKLAAATLSSEHCTPELRAQVLADLDRQADKLDFLISALVKMSRLENGIVVPRPEVLSVDELVENACAAVAAQAEGKGIAVAYTGRGAEACFDSRWMGEALFNLLDNAVKYTPEGGTVTVAAETMVLYTRIDVADTGIGIRPEHLTDIFKRFYRENRMPDAEGVGIGLYLAREIAALQGGYITVRSEPGEGTVFSLHLPRAC